MEIELGQLMRAIRRWWVVPVVLGLVLGLLGFGMAQVTRSTTYTATTQMLVTEQISGDEVLASGSRTQTYVELITSGPVLDRVILELGLEYTREEMVEGVVEAHAIGGTQIIEIIVTTDDPELSADIANALSRNFVVTATDLSVGEMQRNLDDLRQQTSSIRDRITVIDTRLAEIDTEENAEDSQVQAEIAQLERERIQASQTLSDLESTIRQLNTNLSTMSIPVVVTDFAQPPEEGDGSVSPVLIALLGVFLGGLIGSAWILWAAFTDRKVRAAEHVVSLPLFGGISKSDVASEESGAAELLAAKLAGVRAAIGDDFILATTRDSTSASELRAALSHVEPESFAGLTVADSVLTEASAMKIASSADHVIVIAEVNKTSIDDLEELARVLPAMNTSVLGTIIVE